MATRDPNSADMDPREGVDQTDALRKPKLPGEMAVPQSPGRIGGERRHPDNAIIRRWMNLGDKALQSAATEAAAEDEKESPIRK